MMIFDINSKKDAKIKRMYDKSMKELNEFFKINWIKHKPGIILIPNRKILDTFRGRKTERWDVGWAEEHIVFLLSKQNYEKESSHKYSDREYFRLIKHEITHLFVDTFTKGNCNPLWLIEGIAVYLSGQNESLSKLKKFSSFLDFYYKFEKKGYFESGFAVECLTNRYGKQKLLRLIKSLSEVKNQTQFNKSFKKIYCENPTYKFFNGMLK